jgi:hypothetical protein
MPLVEGGARMGVTNQNDPYEDQKRDLLAFASTAAKPQRRLSCPLMSWRKGWVKSRSCTRCRPAILNSWAMP